MAAADFFTVEIWGPRGLVTFYVFFVIQLTTRRIEIAGIPPKPNEAWMMQVGRNLTDSVDGFLTNKRFPITDRDSKYSLAFRTLLDNRLIEPEDDKASCSGAASCSARLGGMLRFYHRAAALVVLG